MTHDLPHMREEVATSCRILARHGLIDGVLGHVSARIPGGMALRFARVKRYRDDKPAAEADTVETVRAIAATPGGGAGDRG